MEGPVAEIKPSVGKAFTSNMIYVSVVVILIIGTLIYLNNIVGLGVFIDTFREFGVEISTARLLGWFIFVILFFTVLLLILDYVNLGKVRYVFYPNKLVYNKSFLIFQITEKTVPFSNITRVSHQKKQFLNTSKITIELTGMKEDKLELKFIDDAEEVLRELQDLIREQKARYYAQYTQDYGMQNIVDRYNK